MQPKAEHAVVLEDFSFVYFLTALNKTLGGGRGVV